jgi:hypothetical protein
MFVVASIYLIATFLWRFFVPAHEYPMREEQVLTIIFDLLVLGGLIGMKVGADRAAGNDPDRALPSALFWIALAAGLGLFAIRMGSDASWWTGHRIYFLEPR